MSRHGLIVSASRPEVAKGRLGTGPVKPLKNGPFKGVSLLGHWAAVTGKVAYDVTTEPIISRGTWTNASGRIHRAQAQVPDLRHPSPSP